MTTFEVLNSHPISSLKKHISQSNIKGYSRLKKKELIELMIKHKEKFAHVTKKEKAKTKAKAPSKAKPQTITKPTIKNNKKTSFRKKERRYTITNKRIS